MHGLSRTLAVLCVVVSFSAATVAHAGSKSADKKEFQDFKALVADFSETEKIEAWQAFLQKYPDNRYRSEVKKILADLRGEKKATPQKKKAVAKKSQKPRQANPSSVSADPDLDFLTEVNEPVFVEGDGKPATDDVLADVGDVGEPEFPDDPFAAEPLAPTPAPRKVKKAKKRRVETAAAPVAADEPSDDPFASGPSDAELAAEQAEREAAQRQLDQERQALKQRERAEKERERQAKAEQRRLEKERKAAEKARQKQLERQAKAREEEQERRRALAAQQQREREAAQRAQEERAERERNEAAQLLAEMRGEKVKKPKARQVKKAKERKVAFVDKPVRNKRSSSLTPDTMGTTRSGATFSRDGGFHVEINPHVGLAPDEVYVRNPMFGAGVGLHLGRFIVLEGEALGSAAQETDVLAQLRARDAEPEVISKHNYAVGGALAVNVLGGHNELLGRRMVRHDFFLRGGGGIVNTNLEICTPDDAGNPCVEPLYIDGANFSYFTVGAGHRYYVTKWLALRTEARYRVIFELIDNVTTPVPNFQLNAGASIVF